jgi:spore coat polysaccharide biosynthesis protein SpsF (cytidylyltransferase family)
MTRVLIGIQARSTSQRLPGKALTKLYNKPVLTWVLNACLDSANFIRRRSDLEVYVAILCPYDDEIKKAYNQIPIIEGDEFDVLSRYVDGAIKFRADYICRITGDCPFLTGFMITNHIFKAVNNHIDYLSNVDPKIRTELDGRDIEVMSIKALNWLNRTAKTEAEKEHVTVRLREVKPTHLKRGHFLNRLDMSDIKLSVDTQAELDEAESKISNFFKKKSLAEMDVGQENVFYV